MQIRYLFLYILFVSLTACNSSTEEGGGSSGFGGLSISGTLNVPANTASDSDVNSLDANNISNNSVETAQILSTNPMMLGGYAARAGTGENGALSRDGDETDFFRISLYTGQTINLFVASDDLDRNDLDLLLLNENGEVLDASTDRNHTETLFVPRGGRYIIQVLAHRGASNYVLTIGYSNKSFSNTGLRLNSDFIADEVTVKFKPQANETADFQAQALTAQAVGLEKIAGVKQQRSLFRLTDSGQRTLALNHPRLKFKDAQTQAKYQTLLAIKQLQLDDNVQTAEPNYIYHAMRVPNDNLYHLQWHYNLIHLPQAWDITTGNTQTIVAVVDTGVLTNHPDLRDKIYDGFDFISSTDISMDGDGIDANAYDPGNAPNAPGGSSFHGTHVAGTIAASTNNARGTAGVSWGSLIMPMRVLGKNSAGTDFDIEQAVRYAAGLTNSSGRVPDRIADVINLSLGGADISSGLRDAINTAYESGIVILAAAGNSGDNTVSYPAALNNVVSVSAVDINRKRASYSNFGSTIDIAAPGGGSTADINGDGAPDGIISTVGNDSSGRIKLSYASSIGTSMATPHVAGVIALMKSVYPQLTAKDFFSLLRSGQITDDLGVAGKDDSYGYGLINAFKAVNAALGLAGGGNSVVSTPAKLIVSPTLLNFGLSTTTLSLNSHNAGGDNLSIERITETSNGVIKITNGGLNSQRLGTYQISIDRSRLLAGSYEATLSFVSNANTVNVRVVWQVGDSASSGDVGQQYVLLINPDTMTTLQQVTVSANQGRYPYRFNNVAKGHYLIISGSDNNNNGTICDLGESCGAYLTLDRPNPIQLNNNLRDINFDLNYNTSFLIKTGASLAQHIYQIKPVYQRLKLKQVD